MFIDGIRLEKKWVIGLDDAEFESKHKRDKGGKFATVAGSGEGAAPEKEAPEKEAKAKATAPNTVQYPTGKAFPHEDPEKVVKVLKIKPDTYADKVSKAMLGQVGKHFSEQDLKSLGGEGDSPYNTTWAIAHKLKLNPELGLELTKSKSGGQTHWGIQKTAKSEAEWSPSEEEYPTQTAALGKKDATKGETSEPKKMPPGEWKQTGPQMGSNQGGVFTAPDGSKQYVKFYKNMDQAKTEVAAGNVYDALGIQTVKSSIQDVNGKEAIVSPMQEGLKSIPHGWKPTDKQNEQLAQLYVAGTLTKNWDILGLTLDNIKLDKDDNLVSLDAGGAFDYRAQGSKKSYGGDINEWDTFKNQSTHSKLFQGIPPEDINAALDKLKSTPLAKLEKSVPEHLRESFKSRYDQLVAKVGGAPAAKEPEPEPAPAPEPPAPASKEPEPAPAAAASFKATAPKTVPWQDEMGDIHPDVKGVKNSLKIKPDSYADKIANSLLNFIGHHFTEEYLQGKGGEKDSAYNTTWAISNKLKQNPQLGLKLVKSKKNGKNYYSIQKAETTGGEPGEPAKAAPVKTAKSKPVDANSLLNGPETSTPNAPLLPKDNYHWMSYGDDPKTSAVVKKWIESNKDAHENFNGPEAKEALKSLKQQNKAYKEKFGHQSTKLTNAISHFETKLENAETEAAEKKYPPAVPHEAGYYYFGQDPETAKLAQKYTEYKGLQSDDDVKNAQETISKLQAEKANLPKALHYKIKNTELSLKNNINSYLINQGFSSGTSSSVPKEPGVPGTWNGNYYTPANEHEKEQVDVLKNVGGHHDISGAKNRLIKTGLTGKMSPMEMASISHYTGGGFSQVNKQLRTGKPDNVHAAYAHQLNQALDKYPSAPGLTRRGTNLSKNDIQQYRDALGKTIREKAFMSTSKGSGFNGNVKFHVTGKNGKHIQDVSHFPNEQEVLYKAGTHFHVTKVEDKDGKTHIHLTEAD